jgi:acyl-CoA reductase-like NAD-dependent aldehyde dehydrogenase
MSAPAATVVSVSPQQPDDVVADVPAVAPDQVTATSRAIVVGDACPFAEALASAVAALGVGDPADQCVSVGPVITADSRARVVDAAARVRSDGGRVVCEGDSLDRPGWFVAPTIVDGVAPEHPVAQEEVFGPLCAVLQAASPEEAVRLANGVRYGLVGALFTRDLRAALTLSGQLDTGLVRVNASTAGVDFYAPFGGEKASSYGPREQGKAARDFYTRLQTVTMVGL